MGAYLFLYELDDNTGEGCPHCFGSVVELSDLAVYSDVTEILPLSDTKIISIPRLTGFLCKKDCFIFISGVSATDCNTFSNFIEHRQEKIGKYFLPKFK